MNRDVEAINAEFDRLIAAFANTDDFAGPVMLEELKSCWHIYTTEYVATILERGRARLALATRAAVEPERGGCPTCGSPSPELHPAQAGWKDTTVACKDAWHERSDTVPT